MQPDTGATLIIGHSNMDADCLASIVLGGYLFPKALAIRSKRINPLARAVYNLFEDQRYLPSADELDWSTIEHLVVVDTRSPSQLEEYLPYLKRSIRSIKIFDHHVPARASSEELEQLCDQTRTSFAQFFHCDEANISCQLFPCGANVSLMMKELLTTVRPEVGQGLDIHDASLALCGLYADTGHFTHSNVSREDFICAHTLLVAGAELSLVQRLLSLPLGSEQVEVLHQLSISIQNRTMQGYNIQTCTLELQKQISGLNQVVEKLMELERPDALLCVFEFTKEQTHLVIARSSRPAVDVASMLKPLGGGGHAQSASALLHKTGGIPVQHLLDRFIERGIHRGRSAGDLMSKHLVSLEARHSMMEAALILEKADKAAAPVLDAEGRCLGVIDLREIQKARAAGRMNLPCTGYLRKNDPRIAVDTSVDQIEALLLHSDNRRCLVVQDDKLVGLITRSDLLAELSHQAGAFSS